MSELNDKPPEFEPKIPPWLKLQYDALPPMEKWKCDMFSIQDQDNKWMKERHMEADKHRTHINQVVEDLKLEVRTVQQEVQPAVKLAARVMTLRGMIAAVVTLIGIPTLVAFLAEWFRSKFK